MALKQEMSETEKLNLRVKQLEGRIMELERQVLQEQQSRRIAEARQEGYAAAVKDLGRRDPIDNRDPNPYYAFHPMMWFRR